MIVGSWQSPPKRLELMPQASVHLWAIPLVWPVDRLESASVVLDAEECERIARFHTEAHRHRHRAVRIALRHILSKYVALAPQALSFDREAGGKPVLRQLNSGAPMLHFNLSHSGDWAFCAVARGIEVGVDLERLGNCRDVLGIAQRFFAPEEAEALLALPEAERFQMFYRYWTLKEAYIKAQGRGIADHSLETFVVEPGVADWGCLRAAEGGEKATGAWRLANLVWQADGYVAALALKGPIPGLTFLNYSSDVVDITC